LEKYPHPLYFNGCGALPLWDSGHKYIYEKGKVKILEGVGVSIVN